MERCKHESFSGQPCRDGDETEGRCDVCGMLKAEADRSQTLETVLDELFQWCENNVPYFGEAAKGSYDEAVYRRVAKALGNDYTGCHPERLVGLTRE